MNARYLILLAALASLIACVANPPGQPEPRRQTEREIRQAQDELARRREAEDRKRQLEGMRERNR